VRSWKKTDTEISSRAEFGAAGLSGPQTLRQRARACRCPAASGRSSRGTGGRATSSPPGRTSARSLPTIPCTRMTRRAVAPSAGARVCPSPSTARLRSPAESRSARDCSRTDQRTSVAAQERSSVSKRARRARQRLDSAWHRNCFVPS
jgi:hypothetical protein